MIEILALSFAIQLHTAVCFIISPNNDDPTELVNDGVRCVAVRGFSSEYKTASGHINSHNLHGASEKFP